MKIDHFAVSGMKLEEATEYVESTLGYKMEKGGKHKLFGTHNNLLGLKDGLYIEAIAVDPSVKNLNFSKLVIIRPSLLVGTRKSFRLGEVIFTPIMNTLTLFAFGSLKKYKPIKIENVVKAMLYISTSTSNKIVYESNELETLAKSN